ncbi:hypothetical protein L7F22_056950 [Adiantum nelumboides]|nr:hypothetical protein [Adiantum nelumboides]
MVKIVTNEGHLDRKREQWKLETSQVSTGTPNGSAILLVNTPSESTLVGSRLFATTQSAFSVEVSTSSQELLVEATKSHDNVSAECQKAKNSMVKSVADVHHCEGALDTIQIHFPDDASVPTGLLDSLQEKFDQEKATLQQAQLQYRYWYSIGEHVTVSSMNDHNNGMKATEYRYHLLQDNVDDDSSKLTVNRLLQGARDELQLHSSYAQAWGVDLSHDLSHPNKATVKYTEFLLATASSEERKERERTSLDRQRVAAAMTPCMRLYAFLGQEIRNFLGGDSPESPYREWIDTYSSKEFQSSTLQIESLLDTLAAHLGEDDVSKLENLYSQAFTLELEFFSAQPNL